MNEISKIKLDFGQEEEFWIKDQEVQDIINVLLGDKQEDKNE